MPHIKRTVPSLTEKRLKATTFMMLALEEYERSRRIFNPFHTPHEGYAVLLEEVEEVWQEVKHPTSPQHFQKELVQVAAMAMAIAVEMVPYIPVEDNNTVSMSIIEQLHQVELQRENKSS